MPHLRLSFLFLHSSFKTLSINSFVLGNVLLIASKTAKAVFSRFLSILITQACSLTFYFGALRSRKYLFLFYTHSWYLIPNMIIECWLVFKISKYGHETLCLVFKIEMLKTSMLKTRMNEPLQALFRYDRNPESGKNMNKLRKIVTRFINYL